jgi:hypothetical protein
MNYDQVALYQQTSMRMASPDEPSDQLRAELARLRGSTAEADRIRAQTAEAEADKRNAYLAEWQRGIAREYRVIQHWLSAGYGDKVFVLISMQHHAAESSLRERMSRHVE